MKKIILACAGYLITLSVYAQNPDEINNKSNKNLNNKINQDGNNPYRDNNTANPNKQNRNVDPIENPIIQDSMHTEIHEQPVKTSTPVKASSKIKKVKRATTPFEKRTVKTRKDKNMYLVPDSSNKKVDIK